MDRFRSSYTSDTFSLHFIVNDWSSIERNLELNVALFGARSDELFPNTSTNSSDGLPAMSHSILPLVGSTNTLNDIDCALRFRLPPVSSLSASATCFCSFGTIWSKRASQTSLTRSLGITRSPLSSNTADSSYALSKLLPPTLYPASTLRCTAFSSTSCLRPVSPAASSDTVAKGFGILFPAASLSPTVTVTSLPSIRITPQNST